MCCITWCFFPPRGSLAGQLPTPPSNTSFTHTLSLPFRVVVRVTIIRQGMMNRPHVPSVVANTTGGGIAVSSREPQHRYTTALDPAAFVVANVAASPDPVTAQATSPSPTQPTTCAAAGAAGSSSSSSSFWHRYHHGTDPRYGSSDAVDASRCASSSAPGMYYSSSLLDALGPSPPAGSTPRFLIPSRLTVGYAAAPPVAPAGGALPQDNPMDSLRSFSAVFASMQREASSAISDGSVAASSSPLSMPHLAASERTAIFGATTAAGHDHHHPGSVPATRPQALTAGAHSPSYLEGGGARQLFTAGQQAAATLLAAAATNRTQAMRQRSSAASAVEGTGPSWGGRGDVAWHSPSHPMGLPDGGSVAHRAACMSSAATAAAAFLLSQTVTPTAATAAAIRHAPPPPPASAMSQFPLSLHLGSTIAAGGRSGGAYSPMVTTPGTLGVAGVASSYPSEQFAAYNDFPLLTLRSRPSGDPNAATADPSSLLDTADDQRVGGKEEVTVGGSQSARWVRCRPGRPPASISARDDDEDAEDDREVAMIGRLYQARMMLRAAAGARPYDPQQQHALTAPRLPVPIAQVHGCSNLVPHQGPTHEYDMPDCIDHLSPVAASEAVTPIDCVVARPAVVCWPQAVGGINVHQASAANRQVSHRQPSIQGQVITDVATLSNAPSSEDYGGPLVPAAAVPVAPPTVEGLRDSGNQSKIVATESATGGAWMIPGSSFRRDLPSLLLAIDDDRCHALDTTGTTVTTVREEGDAPVHDGSSLSNDEGDDNGEEADDEPAGRDVDAPSISAVLLPAAPVSLLRSSWCGDADVAEEDDGADSASRVVDTSGQIVPSSRRIRAAGQIRGWGPKGPIYDDDDDGSADDSGGIVGSGDYDLIDAFHAGMSSRYTPVRTQAGSASYSGMVNLSLAAGGAEALHVVAGVDGPPNPSWSALVLSAPAVGIRPDIFDEPWRAIRVPGEEDVRRRWAGKEDDVDIMALAEDRQRLLDAKAGLWCGLVDDRWQRLHRPVR